MLNLIAGTQFGEFVYCSWWLLLIHIAGTLFAHFVSGFWWLVLIHDAGTQCEHFLVPFGGYVWFMSVCVSVIGFMVGLVLDLGGAAL